MKKLSIFLFSLLVVAIISFSSCYKLQKDYQYNGFSLDPNIKMTAKEFLLSRGVAGVGSDTVFKWMQLGIEYAGIDMAEYEKSGRTYIFLHNSAIRTTTGSGASQRTNGGFFFDYPVPAFDAAGLPIKSKLVPTEDSLKPAFTWSDYPKDFVKNYFLYLIIQGEYGFDNLKVANTSVQTLLPAGTVVDPKVSKLGWVVVKATPNPDLALASNIFFDKTIGKGFDPEGKMNLRLANTQNAPIQLNDKSDDRSAGYIATNGQIHVFGFTLGSTSTSGPVHPFRYSYQ